MQAPYAPTPLRLGPYELLKKLATGGMAEIYEARREGPHGFSKRIALKRILPQLAADPEFVAMFIDEARLCAQLTHPNLVQVFDFGEEGCELYIAMELVEGTTAAKVARAAASRGDPVPVEVALHVALSVGRGLAHAHEALDEDGRPLGLVHRDVSPGNILVSRSGAVKLGDFGIARASEFERRTEQGQLKGKLGYMSPEQVTGRELDPKSDQFTAAIVLAELLTARPLFSGPREMDVLVKIRDADLSVLERHGRHLPTDLMVVLRRALARRREDRFSTTGAYVDALEEVVRRRRLLANPATLVEWLNHSGLLRPTGRSGEHSIEALPGGRVQQLREAEPPVSPSRSSGAQRIWKPESKLESVPPDGRETLSTRAASASGSNATAEIAIHSSGKWLYGSNRGDHNIVVFSIGDADGKMTLIDHTDTGGSTPRHFSIDPTGKFLLAANQMSNNLVVFRIGSDGKLTQAGNPTAVSGAMPTFVGALFLP